MRGGRAGWLAVIVLVVATARGGSPVPGAGFGSAESDLSRQPAYLAPYLRRFTDPHGYPVRLDVMMWLEVGCVSDASIFLSAGAPIGFDLPAGDGRTYLHAPVSAEWSPPPSPPYSPAVPLPGTAVDTGYHRGHIHLWVTPHDDSAIYLVRNTDRTAERWPLQRVQVGCA
jgi:hypothetical protein